MYIRHAGWWLDYVLDLVIKNPDLFHSHSAYVITSIESMIIFLISFFWQARKELINLMTNWLDWWIHIILLFGDISDVELLFSHRGSMDSLWSNIWPPYCVNLLVSNLNSFWSFLLWQIFPCAVLQIYTWLFLFRCNFCPCP